MRSGSMSGDGGGGASPHSDGKKNSAIGTLLGLYEPRKRPRLWLLAREYKRERPQPPILVIRTSAKALESLESCLDAGAHRHPRVDRPAGETAAASSSMGWTDRSLDS